MAAGDVLEVRAERLVAGGAAVAREPSGRVVFVDGALPGERVLATVTDERRDYAQAVVATVLEPGAGRVEPPCPHVAEGCGGCTWQHLAVGDQLDAKLALVTEALVRTGKLADPVVAAGPALRPFGFRTTLRLAVRPDGRLGLRAHRSHAVVPVDGCLVAHPRLVELLGARWPGADEVVLRVSAATGERLAFAPPGRPAAGKARGGGRSAPRGFPPDVALGPDAVLHEVVAGARFRVSARSFFQTRTDGAGALVTAVIAAAEGAGGPMVDAYAGVGLFAATVGAGREVTAVEQSASSAADARHNLSGATVVRSAVERWRPQRAGLLVADPARRGLGAQAVAVLAATGAPRLVLVSCDPVSLARDARLLAAAGYDHGGSTVVDLFPHTPHVEVVTRFDRR
jgi:23S rRNA (uracil1939-C5)-methyltransferase